MIPVDARQAGSSGGIVVAGLPECKFPPALARLMRRSSANCAKPRRVFAEAVRSFPRISWFYKSYRSFTIANDKILCPSQSGLQPLYGSLYKRYSERLVQSASEASYPLSTGCRCKGRQMLLADRELIEAFFKTALSPQPRRRRQGGPTPRLTAPARPAATKAKRRVCRCGQCSVCRDNVRWDRIYKEKFADPEYYRFREAPSGSPLNAF